jgi:hypothetical protein
MPVVAANDRIVVYSFGKPGEHCSFENDSVHFWANSIDPGIYVAFRQDPAPVNVFSFKIKGSIIFPTEWGRVRFECYDDILSDPCHVYETFLKDVYAVPDDFREVAITFPRTINIKKMQILFLGPTIVDVRLKDFVVK